MTAPNIFFIYGINPEPWTAPEVSVGRKAGGVAYPQVYKSAALRTYQAAVADALAAYEPECIEEDEISLTFLVWRALPDYETERGARARKHVADATNIQKALEDACQGILFKNDRQCRETRTEIVEQGFNTESVIVILVEPYRPDQDEITSLVTRARSEAPAGIDIGKARAAVSADTGYDPKELF